MSSNGNSRLESLNRKNSGAKPKAGLKFRPKVVARKTDKERTESDAPTIKQEVPEKKRIPKKNRNFQGNKRGGRGESFIKTEIVASGPLGNTVVSGNSTKGDAGPRFHSLSPTPDYFTSLKRNLRSQSATATSDDEEDDSKININRDFDGVEDFNSTLFPVRPVQFKQADSSSESLVKQEIKNEQQALDDADADYVASENKSEAAQIYSDNLKIMKLIEEPASDENLMLLQLPKAFETVPEEGRIGSLRVHKDGRISMVIGGQVMDLVTSGNSGFLQDLVASEITKPEPQEDDMDVDERPGTLYQVGQVKHKVLGIPRVGQ